MLSIPTKKLIFLCFFLAITLPLKGANAGSIAAKFTDMSFSSDMKVYFTDMSFSADEKWYITGECSAASALKIYVTDMAFSADLKIYITDMKYGADRDICLVNPKDAPKEFWKAYKPNG